MINTTKSCIKENSNLSPFYPTDSATSLTVKGEGGAKDIERGIQLWESAAELGDEGSQKNLDMISANHFLLVLE